MKAFEKWFENYLNELTGRWAKLMAKQMKSLYKYIWRDALEWAENQFVGKSAFEVEEAINKELRE